MRWIAPRGAPEAIAAGAELAWQDGWQVRRVRVLTPATPGAEPWSGIAAALANIGMGAPGRDASVTMVEVLDDPARGWRGSYTRAPCGERVPVSAVTEFVSTWAYYSAWRDAAGAARRHA